MWVSEIYFRFEDNITLAWDAGLIAEHVKPYVDNYNIEMVFRHPFRFCIILTVLLRSSHLTRKVSPPIQITSLSPTARPTSSATSPKSTPHLLLPFASLHSALSGSPTNTAVPSGRSSRAHTSRLAYYTDSAPRQSGHSRRGSETRWAARRESTRHLCRTSEGIL